MLDLRINNESLDLPPSAQMEVEENNPYLQFTSEVKGQNSWPITIKATPTNIRLTNWAGIFQKRITNSGIDALCFDTGLQHSVGKIMFEKLTHNLNRAQDGDMSLYYLTGTSYFWQDLQNKRLKDVNWGGARTFAWDNYNRAGSGFWGHIHRVVDAPPGYGASGYDYAFFPVNIENVDWDPGGGTLVVNNMAYANGAVTFTKHETYGHDGNFISPQVYLSYVLTKAVQHIGWKLAGNVLSDPQFQKITLLNLRAIDWCVYAKLWVKMGYDPIARPQIGFDLADHIPDLTISELLLALRNRFGWWYDIDRLNKTVHIRKLTDVASGSPKDMTAKAGSVIPKKVLSEKRIFSVKNTSEEQKTDLSAFDYGGVITAGNPLPAASQGLSGKVYLDPLSNNFFICEQNDSGNWTWAVMAANNGDVIPAGATDEVTGNSVVPAALQFSSYLDLIPHSVNGAYWPGRTEDDQSALLELCFYYGKQTGRTTGQVFPFASSHIYAPNGTQVGAWSLSLLAKDISGAEIGLYEIAFKPFVSKLETSEEMEVTLYLTRQEFLELTFADMLHIDGVRMYVKKRNYVLPFNGVLSCECSRI